MPPRPPKISASLLEGYSEFIARAGLDIAMLLPKAKLRPDDLTDMDRQLDLNRVALLMHLAAERAGRPGLGLEWANAYRRGASGVLGYLLMHAPNAQAALKDVKRYVSLLLHPVDVRYEEGAETGVLSWRFPDTLTAPRAQLATFLMGALVVRLRDIVGPSWFPHRLELEHYELDCRPITERTLGRNILYNREHNAIHMIWKNLTKVSANTDHRLFKLITDLAERYL
ncbi:MAG: AraC family transcriptional regulator ligand-binding domain-containing protein, partial [Parvularculaceae bacterium]|nr:AraC family transcriptional regulator ligand-binding domain-containing protein [Parvularculaceae bacterium]